jgi:hypothetical protein
VRYHRVCVSLETGQETRRSSFSGVEIWEDKAQDGGFKARLSALHYRSPFCEGVGLVIFRSSKSYLVFQPWQSAALY